MGNESCDLDSVVSALTLAFFYTESKMEFCPVLNMARADYPIKTEVCFFLKMHGITDEFLTFKDDIMELENSNCIILVDHHVSPYRRSVIEVFDHHQFDSSSGLNATCKTTIKRVGSCATLIADLILQSQEPKTGHLLIALELLYGAIVLDTINFSKCAELDLNVANEIEMLTKVNREKLFMELVNARSDISSLSTLQLLYKDMKSIINGELKVCISALPISVQEYIKKSPENSLRLFANDQNCNVVVLMGMKIGNTVYRDIGIINISSQHICDEIVLKIHEHNLQLRELGCSFLGGRFFRQGNIKATRKQILPVVNEILFEQHLQ